MGQMGFILVAGVIYLMGLRLVLVLSSCSLPGPGEESIP